MSFLSGRSGEFIYGYFAGWLLCNSHPAMQPLITQVFQCCIRVEEKERVHVGDFIDDLGGRLACPVAGIRFDADKHGVVALVRLLERGGKLERVRRHHPVVVVAGGDDG